MSRRLVRVGPLDASDQQLGGGTEHVVMGYFAALLGLDPLGAKAVVPAPLLEHRPQADDVQERLLTHHPPDRRAVVVVEVAVDGDATGLGEGDGLFDLAPLEVLLVKRRAQTRPSQSLPAYASECGCPRVSVRRTCGQMRDSRSLGEG